jgi:hypothetical protein
MPFLTSQLSLDIKETQQRTRNKGRTIYTFNNGDVDRSIVFFSPSVQELFVIDDLLGTSISTSSYDNIPSNFSLASKDKSRYIKGYTHIK